MKNVIKGWVTSLIGLAIMVCAGLYFFGILIFPNPESLHKNTEIAIAFGVGLFLFLVPPSWIEEKLKGFVNKKADKL
jgi:O-antigen/teichoic acid export membrane protein